VLLLLKQDEIDLPECKREANSKGFLLPFLNGVLNTLTLELLPHHCSHFITHMIPINLDLTVISLANTAMSQFLINICNNSSNRLNILRACLYCIFTNKLYFQIALYIYGPGESGMSTVISILRFLLGDAALSTTTSQLHSRFLIASLIDKMLVSLNDISLFRGVEPKIIQEIITGDRLLAKFKFLKPFQFTPTSFLIITANIL
jgi:phage/plasmid-associated DNA primase